MDIWKKLNYGEIWTMNLSRALRPPELMKSFQLEKWWHTSGQQMGQWGIIAISNRRQCQTGRVFREIIFLQELRIWLLPKRLKSYASFKLMHHFLFSICILKLCKDIYWDSVMATVGSWGGVESGSRRYLHSIPPLPPNTQLKKYNSSLEMKFVLCVPSINNLGLQKPLVIV